ncbi:BrnA antitoxin family protein [Schauerella aestuarii]|uniref:BrnA antitoxin family protein n=1 Tax=Schauerella aestuarii TaxID=2511204 RepID=UPI00136F3EB3|nr:BrnA antitoxin family protein [Achromobacter aestuarii]MYZ44203.1 hypothetical protein [Achromobacter aestuarii]
MPKLKAGTIIPTAAEDAQIQKGIDADPDTYVMTDEEWAKAKPVARIGRPKADVTKERITIRLSPEVVDGFRSTGSGWQTRIDAALKDWLRNHKPADAR